MEKIYETIFNLEEFIKHLVLKHVLNMSKVIFLRKIIAKHEQNVVKSGLNAILPAWDVKKRWSVQVIL